MSVHVRGDIQLAVQPATSARRGPQPYERVEVCICCIVWPLVAVASAALLYWLFLDPEHSTGWFSRAASTVFVVVLVASVVCTLDVWSRLALDVLHRLRDRGAGASA
jgi:hypothetical protein